MNAGDCVRETGNGYSLLAVRVTPKASKDAIEAIAEDDSGRAFLKVKVRAIPDNGAANKAVCVLLSKAFRLPKTSVTITSGQTARLKQVELAIPVGQAVKTLNGLLDR